MLWRYLVVRFRRDDVPSAVSLNCSVNAAFEGLHVDFRMFATEFGKRHNKL
jgi:hypothetical protein